MDIMAAPQALLASGGTLLAGSIAAGSQLPDTPAEFGVIVGFGVLVAGAVVWLDRWRNGVHDRADRRADEADKRADAAEDRVHKAELSIRDAEIVAKGLEVERLRSELADATNRITYLEHRLEQKRGTDP